jgi:hypothetical protein
MQIRVYDPKAEAMAALAQGLVALGHQVATAHPRDYDGPDPAAGLVAVYGVKGTAGRILRDHLDLAVPVAVLDVGHVLRDQGYCSVGLNRLGWLPRAGNEARRKALGLQAQAKRRDGGHVLVCGQMPHDAGHCLSTAGLARWAQRAVDAARLVAPERAVVWRPHPHGLDVPAPAGASRNSDPRRTDLAQDLAGCWAVCTHSSMAGLEALMAGVPVVCAPQALYAEAANLDLNALKAPVLPARAELLARIAAATWSLEEMAQGAPMLAWAETIPALAGLKEG